MLFSCANVYFGAAAAALVLLMSAVLVVVRMPKKKSKSDRTTTAGCCCPLTLLPVSLQHHILLEWLLPKAVCAVARAGSSSLRRAVLSAPQSFSAGETIVAGGCLRWFKLRHLPPLRLWVYSTSRDDLGARVWFKNEHIHRDDDLPAVVWDNGGEEWYQDGKLHRDGDKPAVVGADGARQWWKHGKPHRKANFPAFILANGIEVYFRHGELLLPPL